MGEAQKRLKDDAVRATRRGHHRLAADLYQRLAGSDDHPMWWQRAGEALLRDGQREQAAKRHVLAAALYAARGELKKAVLLCREALAVHYSDGIVELICELEGRLGDPAGVAALEVVAA